jgi:hypothetical protein
VARQTVKAIPYHRPPRATEHPPLQCENTKIVASGSFGLNQRKVCLNFCRHGVERSPQYLPSVDTLLSDEPAIHCPNSAKIEQ